MKNNNYSSKIFLVFAIGILAFTSYSQEKSQIWASIPVEGMIPSVNSDGNLVSSNALFNNLISSLSITSVVKALPASKQEKLQNVYEITCNCNEQDLVAAFTKESSIAQGIVFAPKYETLYTPNDYSLEFSTDYALDLINAHSAWDITTALRAGIVASWCHVDSRYRCSH